MADEAETASEPPTEARPASGIDQLGQLVHRMPLVPAVGMLIFGIGISHWCPSISHWALTAPAVALCLGAMAAFAWNRQRIAFALVWFLLPWIGATAHRLQRGRDNDELGRSATRDYQPLVFRAEIVGGAIWRPNSFFRPGSGKGERWQTQWKVRCTAVRDSGKWRPVDSVSTLSVAGRIDNLLPGDRITVFGSCAAVTGPSNPGGNDLREVYRAEQQFVFLRAESPDQIVLNQKSWQRPVARTIALSVRRIDRAIHQYVPFGQAPLAAALIFGQRQQVDWDAQQQLLSTGTLHMLAISGMHIELVAAALLLACWFISLSQRLTIIVVGSTIAIYALIAGANPPVLRAVFVVLAVCVARWQGRRTGLANLLAFSGLLVLALNSTWIANVGVQLSFLAVATIAIFARGIGRRGSRIDALTSVIEDSLSWRERALRRCGRTIWQLSCLSYWVWLLTAPLIWSNFHVVSPIAIPLNVLLTIPLIVGLLSGLILSVAWWFPPLAWLMGLLCGASLWSISLIVWLGDLVPSGHFWMPAPSRWWMITFYSLAAVGIVCVQYRPGWRRWLGAGLFGWLILGMSPWLVGPHGHGPDWLARLIVRNLPATADHSTRPTGQRELRVTFIDVGHGTSALMQLPSGEVWLYDAGHLGSGERSHQEIAQVLWRVPTARIDRLFISHADADHYNAVPGLIERFSIREVTAPPQFWQHLAPELGELRQSFQRWRVPTTRLVQGESFGSGTVTVDVLHPPGDWSDKVDNGNSLTLLVKYAGCSCLLPGDLEKAGLQRLLAQPAIDCDVLMAPHHGSMTHDPTPIFDWCQPQWIVISGGPRAARESVVKRYSPPGSRTAVTHLHGAIQLRVREDGTLSMWHWLETNWHRCNECESALREERKRS